MKEFYFFPGMRRYTRQHIKACLHCIANKAMSGKKKGLLHPISPGSRPFQIIHVDHIESCKDTSCDQVVKILDRFCITYGAPERLILGRGTCFTAKGFEDFCKSQGIKHTLNSPRHAQANGQVERVNRTLIPTIQAKDWDSVTKKVEMCLNTTFNKSTNQTPFETLYGFEHLYGEGLASQFTTEEENQGYKQPDEVQDKARESISKAQTKYKDKYD
ncbi:hypothetical protein TKK_0008711 [Trichogramma kaykai]